MSNIKEEIASNKDCFIIMPISDPTGYESGHFKRVYEDIIKPACNKVGLNPVRADDIAQTGMIHLEILQRLLNSSMAICDLSSHNPNVLFELGIRQAFDMPTVLIQDEDTKPIFDIAPLKYCQYRKSNLYREVIEDQDKLVGFLNKTTESMEKGEIANSIVKLLNINKASLGENATDNASLAYSYILSELNQVKNEIRKATSLYPVHYEVNDPYAKILLSLNQLNEMIKNGTPRNIFNRNYLDLKNQITNIPDTDIKTFLMNNLEDVKSEGDKFM